MQIREFKIIFRRAKYLCANIGYFRSHLRECMEAVDYKRELIITYCNKPAAVLINFTEYKRMRWQLHMLLKELTELSSNESEDDEDFPDLED